MEMIEKVIRKCTIIFMAIAMIAGLFPTTTQAVSIPDAADITITYDLSANSVIIESEGTYVINQTESTTENTITVNSNATIYLNGVNILVPHPDDNDHSKLKSNPINISGPYVINLYIVDGSINTLASETGNVFWFGTNIVFASSSSGSSKAGLRVPTGATLNIYGNTGELNATGAVGFNRSENQAHGGGGAGIGGNGGYSYGGINDYINAEASGEINILGGVINATGGDALLYYGNGGPGIGGGGARYNGSDGNSGNVVVENGYITAKGGNSGEVTNLSKTGYAISGELTIKTGTIIGMSASAHGANIRSPFSKTPVFSSDYLYVWRTNSANEFTQSTDQLYVYNADQRYVEISVKHSPIISISANPTSGVHPANVALTATVIGADTNVDKLIHFYKDGVLLGSSRTNNLGEATIDVNNLSAKSYSFYARFEGDNVNFYAQSTVINFTVTKATQSLVTFENTNAINKTYGDASFTLPSVSGGSGTGEYSYRSANPEVATVLGNVVTITGVGEATIYVKKLGDANYNDSEEASVKVVVSPKLVTISGIVANNKVYNGTMNTTYDFSSATIDGLINSDMVSINVSNASATFSDKNVGTNKTVTFSGFALTGSDVANYILSKQPESVTANITPREVTISGISAENKLYDGTNVATLIFPKITVAMGLVLDDTLSVSATGTFADSNVSDSIVVDISELTLSGASVSNYVLSQEGQQTSTTANITPATITVIPGSGQTKYYGQSDPVLSYSYTGAVLEETPNFTGTLTRSDGENVASNYKINQGTLALSNNQSFIASNYQLAFDESSVTFEIKEYTTSAIAITIPNGDHGWFKSSPIILKAPVGYLISDSNALENNVWGNSIEINDTDRENKSTSYYLRVNTALNQNAISTSKTFNYNVDKNAPTGTVTIDTNTFTTFLNNITFGLFFKNTVDVIITAEDETSGLNKIEFYRSEDILSEEDITTLSSWNLYDNKISEEPIDALKFIYYVKITDNAGNVTYIASNGVTFDTTPPVIHNITDEAVYYVDQIVTVTDTNLLDMTLNGNAFESGQKLIGNSETTYVLVTTDKAGNSTTFTVEMKSIASLSLNIDLLTIENVTSDDKIEVEAVKSKVEEVLLTTLNGATQEQIDALNSIIAKCNDLLNTIQGVQEKISDVDTKTDGITTDNVKSNDQENLEDALETIIELLETDNLTDDERTELELKKTEVENNIKTILDIQSLIAKAYESVQNIKEDNVVKKDRETLEKAFSDLQLILKDKVSNLTVKEIKDIEDKMISIKSIINVLNEVSIVEELIEALPNTSDVTKANADAIVKTQQAYDKLSNHQKTMVEAILKTKLDAITEALRQMLLFDTPTGIKLEGINGTVFDLKTELVVTTVMETLDNVTMERFALSVNALENDLEIIQLFDIKLMLDGLAIQPNGMVKVTLPLSDNLKDYTNLQIVFIEEDGTVKRILSTISDHEISFMTDHFSYYGITGTPTSDPIPDTSNPSNNYVWWMMLLGSLLVVVTGKKKEGEIE